MWPLFIKNKQQLDKKEKRMQNYVKLFFSEKKFFQRGKSH